MELSVFEAEHVVVSAANSTCLTGFEGRLGRAATPYPRRRAAVVTTDEIRAVAQTLPRSYEVFVHGQIKFRVGQIVWLALSKDAYVTGIDVVVDGGMKVW